MRNGIFNNLTIMINAIFYNLTEPTNKVNKTLENGVNINGLMYTPFDDLTAQIKLRYPNNFEFNYLYLQQLDKYFFINNVSCENTNIITLDLFLDVLMTYKQKILNSYGYVTKNENSNKFISNREFLTDERVNIEKINFPNSGLFDENGKIIMVTIKGNK